MKIKALILASLLCPCAAIACDKPAPPVLPDPNTAVTAQMVKAKNEIKAFIIMAEAYLKCVETDDGSYNLMVEEMQAAAEEFNKIVRKYKKRMAG